MTSDIGGAGREIDTTAVIRAAAHPVQSVVIDVLTGEGPATIKKLAAVLDRPESTVRGHIGHLYETGVLQVVAERKRRGMLERVYGVNLDSLGLLDRDMADLVLHRRLRMQSTRLMMGGISKALSTGTLTTRSDHVFSWRRGYVDSQGWKELAALHRRTARDAIHVMRASAERISPTADTCIRVGSGIQFFELPR